MINKIWGGGVCVCVGGTKTLYCWQAKSWLASENKYFWNVMKSSLRVSLAALGWGTSFFPFSWTTKGCWSWTHWRSCERRRSPEWLLSSAAQSLGNREHIPEACDTRASSLSTNHRENFFRCFIVLCFMFSKRSLQS